jgi:hypothetical protein
MSIYGNHGSARGTHAYSEDGKYNGAYYFSNGYGKITVDMSNMPTLNNFQPFTIAAWVRPDSLSGYPYARIVNRYWSNHEGWLLARNANGFGFWTKPGNWHFANFADGTGGIDIEAANWYYVVGVYDPSHIAIYVNGVLGENLSPVVGSFSTSGSIEISDSVIDPDGLRGYVDEVRIWNKSLNQDEIIQQYMMNLNKYDSNKWGLIVNQTKNATAGLVESSYVYQAFVSDLAGNNVGTDERSITIGSDNPPRGGPGDDENDTECDSDDDCTDSNDCTEDSCVDGICTNSQLTGTSCDDGLYCTVNDACSVGVCTGDAWDCDDLNVCTDQSCNETTDSCTYTNNNNSCSDGNACTEDDYCMSGTCTPGPYICPCSSVDDCDDSNSCTDEECISGTCVYSELSGLSCDDNDTCTDGDYCESGRCKSGVNICVDPTCQENWECGEWSECLNGHQTRSCFCQCDDKQCRGDSSLTKRCGSGGGGEVGGRGTLKINTVMEDLSVGDQVEIIIVDEYGQAIDATVIILYPDGSFITLKSFETWSPEIPGDYTITAEKEGYDPDQDGFYVNELDEPGRDLASPLSNALESVVEEITKNPARFALLLIVSITIVFMFVYKGRNKAKKTDEI